MIWHVFLEPVLELHVLSLLGQDTKKSMYHLFSPVYPGRDAGGRGRGVVQREHTHHMGLTQKQSDQPVLG